MTDKQTDPMKKDLHPEAKKLARQHINHFAASLVLQAKLLAFRRSAEVVLTTDVEEALDTITTDRKQTWERQFAMALGSAFFGAFVPGFLAGLSGGNALLTGAYSILGFVGLLLVFWGLRR